MPAVRSWSTLFPRAKAQKNTERKEVHYRHCRFFIRPRGLPEWPQHSRRMSALVIAAVAPVRPTPYYISRAQEPWAQTSNTGKKTLQAERKHISLHPCSKPHSFFNASSHLIASSMQGLVSSKRTITCTWRPPRHTSSHHASHADQQTTMSPTHAPR